MRETYQQEPREQYNADSIREIEKEMFPEFKDDDLLQPEWNIYFYWAPSRHFKSELIALFKGKEIRKVIYKKEWWFSILDIVGVLTDSPQPKTYS